MSFSIATSSPRTVRSGAAHNAEPTVFIGHDDMLKLGDFGLSKALASAAFTNTYVGTP